MLLTPERTQRIQARIQATVERALRERHVSARRASLDVVGNDGLIRDIRAGRLPGLDRIEALYEYLGLEFYHGPRRGPATPDGFAEGGGVMGGRDDTGPRYVPIAWHPAMLRAGEEPALPVAFSQAWLESAGLDPAALAAVRPDYPADVPELIAVVDTRMPANGGPARWCYREGARITVARVQFEPNVTVIFSDDPQGRARVLQGADRGRVRFLGRVVWSGRFDPGQRQVAPG